MSASRVSLHSRSKPGGKVLEHLITPSKVTAWLACPHYLTLESQVAAGTLKRPHSVAGSYAELLRDKGDDPREGLPRCLQADLRVTEIPERPKGETFAAFVKRVGNPFLDDGWDVLFQMPFIHEGMRGTADFIKRCVDEDTGEVSFEPIDSKLTRKEAKPGHVLQLCFYADGIEALTGITPTRMHLELGSGRSEALRVEAPPTARTSVPPTRSRCGRCLRLRRGRHRHRRRRHPRLQRRLPAIRQDRARHLRLRRGRHRHRRRRHAGLQRRLPDRSGKTAPGVCGCGVADTDTDGDGTAGLQRRLPERSEQDRARRLRLRRGRHRHRRRRHPGLQRRLPADPAKVAPGVCGCGVADTDTRRRRHAGLQRRLPERPGQDRPGVCGCGVADTDTDGDGTPDCNDGCPTDPAQDRPRRLRLRRGRHRHRRRRHRRLQRRLPDDPRKTAPGALRLRRGRYRHGRRRHAELHGPVPGRSR